MDEFLRLFRYPPGSGRALLAGTLPLWYCGARFTCKTPTWRLLVSGGVVDLVTASVDGGQGVVPASGRGEVFGVRNSGMGRKEFDSTENPPCNLAGFAVQSRPRVWKRLHPVDFFVIPFLITRGGAVIRIRRGSFLLQDSGEFFPGFVLAHVSRLACSVISCLLRCMREVM